MPQKEVPAARSPRRVILIVLFALVGLAAVSLWCLTLPGASGRRDLTVAIHVPRFLLQVRPLGNGIHFQAIGPAGHMRGFGVEPGTYSHLGSDQPGDGGYRGDHDGYVVGGLGFVAAWLPHTFNGGDYILSPFLALVVPYWFLIAGSAIGLAAALGSLRPLTDRLRRASPPAWYAAAVVLLLFFLANLVPSTAWRPGASLEPRTPWGWVEMTFWPWEVHNEVALTSGFPLECYRRAFIGGQRVDIFHGDDTQGLYQHRMMENVCVALLAAGAAMVLVEAVRRRASAAELKAALHAEATSA
jgi:hypothetical protein